MRPEVQAQIATKAACIAPHYLARGETYSSVDAKAASVDAKKMLMRIGCNLHVSVEPTEEEAEIFTSSLLAALKSAENIQNPVSIPLH